MSTSILIWVISYCGNASIMPLPVKLCLLTTSFCSGSTYLTFLDVVIPNFAAEIILVLLVLHICEGKYNYLNQIEGKVNSEIPSCPHLFHLNSLGSHLQNKRQDMEIERRGLVCETVQQGYQLELNNSCRCLSRSQKGKTWKKFYSD